MRLRQLEITGFKSFAQRTVLDFPSGITAIVGPNGCGKSNVVDAIRWVLGEQSPRHLRGESMEDVVFKGNDRVPPTGMAQVSLTFENNSPPRPQTEIDTDVSTVPVQFRELAEITVSRRYFRSGESEYFINKTPCRLKDITELFLGTGVGTKAYAIIEQGRVEQLINAKPEDRRLFIEEAAGTTLYRSRKLAAERKMERARENLLRVNDVLRELDRQIQYLHRLAKKAEQYRSLQGEVRELDLALSGMQWRRLGADLVRLEAGLALLREQETATAAELLVLEARRAQKSVALASAEDDLARCRQTVAVLQSESESLQQRVDLLARELTERDRRLSRLDADATALGEQVSELEKALEREDQARSEWARLLSLHDAELQCKETDLLAARRLCAGLQDEIETLKGEALGGAACEAEFRNTMNSQARRCAEAHRRIEQLAAEMEDVAQRLMTTERAITGRQAEAASLRDRLQAAEGEKERSAERVRALAEERRRLERRSAELHGALVQVRSRRTSLMEIQENHEGYQPGVRSVLRESRPEAGVLGVVADVFEVPEQYERAVAAALGERLQYVIVRDGSDGVDAVSTLRAASSGRGSFIPLEPRRVELNGHGAGSLNGGSRRLLDLVRVDDTFRSIAEALLGEVVLVPDLNAGLALWRRNGVYVTMVTPDGETIDATGVITGGSERPTEEDIVARRRLLKELTLEVEAQEQLLRQVQQEAECLGETLATEEGALKALDEGVHQLAVALVAAEKDLERLDAERPRWTDRLEAAQFESSIAHLEESQSGADLERIKVELEQLALERERLRGVLEAKQGQMATAAACVEGLGNEVTSIKVLVVEYRQRYEAAVATLARLQAQIEGAALRTQQIADELERARSERAELRAAVDADAARRTAQLAEREAIELSVASARAAVDAVGAAILDDDRYVHARRQQLDETRAEGSQLGVALAEQRLRIEHLAHGIRERYGVEVSDQPAMEEGLDESLATARLERLREHMGRIGEVNVAAIDELRELEERAQFLRSQKQDLERSLEDLERTIQRLNRASRARFAEAFAAANEKFQHVLPRLFRGGEARLVLTNEHNPLEAGVDIVVRPPGKRLETVTLLSGGEKALVAVSLIFSLFLINPTPFCFLDEVDAPLDDANIGRFTDLVREMSDQSQFVVITHNKRTMQAANVLYGVTMEEPGVSKVISVAIR